MILGNVCLGSDFVKQKQRRFIIRRESSQRTICIVFADKYVRKTKHLEFYDKTDNLLLVLEVFMKEELNMIQDANYSILLVH